MLFASLDEITKRSLLDAKLPLQWYLEYLSHSASCLRELSIDTLGIINTKLLPVNDYHAVDLPDDFVDDLAVSIPNGQFLQPVPKNDSITALRVKDATGAYINHTDTSQAADNLTGVFFNPGFLWFWNVNSWGEPTGRQFGGNGGTTFNGYKVFKERRQIQLTETFTSDQIVLKYISDGQSADNATEVDMLAFSAIQAYIAWKSSPNANFKDSPEARTFYNEKRLLRARLNPLTITDLKQVLYNAYSATIKN